MFGQKMTHALRSEMSQKLTHLEASTLAGQNPGEIAARFSGDVDTVEALFTSGVISMAADVCRLISIFAVIAVKNTGLALLLLLVLPVLTAFTRHVQKRMLAAQLENRRAVAGISGQVPEALHNIRTIRALGLENYMEKRYDRRIGESYAAVEKTNFYDAIYSPVVLVHQRRGGRRRDAALRFRKREGAGAVRHVGRHVGHGHQLHFPHLYPHREPGHGDPDHSVRHGRRQAHRRIPGAAGTRDRPKNAGRRKSARGRGSSLTSRLATTSALCCRDLSFTVKSGEQVTLVGRTGAGKSTVFRLLLGLYQPEKGVLTIGGVDVSDITDGERRGCIGCVEQHFARVPGARWWIRSRWAINASRARGRKRPRTWPGWTASIRSFPQGYDTPCSDGMFSQGEWQLLSIARAAAADPAVLLLDEITANLDAETEARVMEALRRASEGRTVLSISHRVYETLGGRTIRIGEEA